MKSTTNSGTIIAAIITGVLGIAAARFTYNAGKSTMEDRLYDDIKDYQAQIAELQIENTLLQNQMTDAESRLAQLNELVHELQTQLQGGETKPTDGRTIRPPAPESELIYENQITTTAAVDWRDPSLLYEVNGGGIDTNPTSAFKISGTQYVSGITVYIGAGDTPQYLLYNLQAHSYSTFTFDLGHIDDTGMVNVTLSVYKDGQLSDSWDLNAENLIQQYRIDTTGVGQLKIEFSSGLNGIVYGSYGIVNGVFA